MKVIYIILLSIVAFLFVISQMATYTDFLCFLHCDRVTVKLVRLSTTFILIGFIIGNANYGLYLNGTNKIKKVQLRIGVYLATAMIIKVLISYTVSLYKLDSFNNFTSLNEVKAENNIISAMDIYSMTGKRIEYYDLNKTKRLYEPLQESIEFYELRESVINDINRTPFYVTAIFLILILSYYLSVLFGKRTIQIREHN